MKATLAKSHPYREWLERTQIVLEDLPGAGIVAPISNLSLLDRQQTFGYTQEDLKFLMIPMASTGEEAVGSMGDDMPIAPMSVRRGSVFAHLKQRFAQVTNPAIDHIRERFVMSTTTLLGPRDPLSGSGRAPPPSWSCPPSWCSPCPAARSWMPTWATGDGPEGMRPALERLGNAAADAVAAGHGILVLSDAALARDRAPIPSLLAVGAVDAALVRAGLRTGCSIVADSGDAIGSHESRACSRSAPKSSIRVSRSRPSRRSTRMTTPPRARRSAGTATRSSRGS